MKTKDSKTGCWLIKRVKIATNITTWDDKRKAQALASILQGQAQAWWDSLEIIQINKENWNNIKASFPRYFKPKHPAKTVCSNLQDLTQKPQQGVYVYFAKNIEMFKRFMGNKHDTMPQVVSGNNVSKKTWTDFEKSLTHYFKIQLFIAGLQDQIWTELMKNTYTNFWAACQVALHLYMIQEINKPVKPVAIAAMINNMSQLNFEEIEVVNAVQARRKQQFSNPPRHQNGPPARSQNGFQNGNCSDNSQCCYWCYIRHLQKDCNKRHTAKAPIVDAKGCPYQNRASALYALPIMAYG
jgi:hypothetical protein